MLVQDKIKLTESQDYAIELILNWLDSDEDEFVLSGFAGTGKTTIIKYLMESHRSRLTKGNSLVKIVTYTGKATQVLKRKGVKAATIHSTIYTPHKNENNKITFILNRFLEVGLFIVDEASMINQQLYDDLKSFKAKILFVGDSGQLEPIEGNFNIMKSPDYMLSEIHRQALQSDIIRFSMHVREGGKPRTFKPTPGKKELFIGPREVVRNSATVADQVLCGFNKTRVAGNQYMREQLGYTEDLVVGDRLICLRNNKNYGIYNGTSAIVKQIHTDVDDIYIVDLMLDCGFELKEVFFEKETLLSGKVGSSYDKDLTHWTYGYFMTTHKAQGSEYPKVLVLEELHPDWDEKRWRYTAITRASEKLIYAV